MSWELWNDAKGTVIDTGSEQDMKQLYFKMIEAGVPEIDLFIEGPGGDQYAWNPNRQPPGWDDL